MSYRWSLWNQSWHDLPDYRVSWGKSPPGSLLSGNSASLDQPAPTPPISLPPVYTHTGDFQTMLSVGEERRSDSPGITAKGPSGTEEIKGWDSGVPTPSSIRAAPLSFAFYIVALHNILTEKEVWNDYRFRVHQEGQSIQKDWKIQYLRTQIVELDYMGPNPSYISYYFYFCICKIAIWKQ